MSIVAGELLTQQWFADEPSVATMPNRRPNAGDQKKLPPGNQLKIEHARCKAIGQGESVVGKVFHQQITDRIGAVDQIKYLERSPNVFEISERVVATPVCLITVEEQGAKTDIDADIGIDDEGIAIAHAAGNIVGKIAAV